MHATVQFSNEELGTHTSGKPPFQSDAPFGRVQIPKPGEKWIVKVETDREPAETEFSRAKGLKVMSRRALVVENEPVMCALIQEVLESAEI